MMPYRCINCKHYTSDLKCEAFPQGIPEEILVGDNDHEKPLKNQGNEIVFDATGKITTQNVSE